MPKASGGPSSFPPAVRAGDASKPAGVKLFAASATAASLTTVRPPGVFASGFMITLCRVEGAFGSEKSCVIPKPLSYAFRLSRALPTPARVRSLSAQAFFRASP